MRRARNVVVAALLLAGASGSPLHGQDSTSAAEAAARKLAADWLATWMTHDADAFGRLFDGPNGWFVLDNLAISSADSLQALVRAHMADRVSAELAWDATHTTALTNGAVLFQGIYGGRVAFKNGEVREWKRDALLTFLAEQHGSEWRITAFHASADSGLLVKERVVAPRVEPEFEGVFMWLDPVAGSLVGLERQLPRVRGSRNAITGGSRVEGEISGGRSPVRIPPQPAPVFVVRLRERTGDPHALLQFFRLKEQGDKRVITMLSRSAWDGSITVGYDEKSLVAFDVAFYGSTSYSLTPSDPLEPGEYCLGLATTEHGYCFGVDAADRR